MEEIEKRMNIQIRTTDVREIDWKEKKKKRKQTGGEGDKDEEVKDAEKE